MKYFICSALLFLFCYVKTVDSKEQFYELTIDYKAVNLTGKITKAMLINGQHPGPVFEFQESDIAIIKRMATLQRRGAPVVFTINAFMFFRYNPVRFSNTANY